MPHPLREKAKGRMVYGVPLIVFMDDVSGNISKQWNKHHVIYMSNANLPREMVEKEFCVRFVTSSPHAAPMELMAAMKESIRCVIFCRLIHILLTFICNASVAAEQGVDAWDCMANEEILLCPYGLLLAGDNPMQAEECSHGGLRCNFFCRTCEVGGTKDEKESLEGFEALFKVCDTNLSVEFKVLSSYRLVNFEHRRIPRKRFCLRSRWHIFLAQLRS